MLLSRDLEPTLSNLLPYGKNHSVGVKTWARHFSSDFYARHEQIIAQVKWPSHVQLKQLNNLIMRGLHCFFGLIYLIFSVFCRKISRLPLFYGKQALYSEIVN